MAAEGAKIFRVMKKYFVLFVFLLIAGISNAQQSVTDSTGCFEDKTWKFCEYKEAYIKNDMVGTALLKKLEIGYDKLSKTYSVYIKIGDSIVNIDVKFSKASTSDDGSTGYLYEGKDRISGEKVVIFCRNKLSLYTKNFGVASKSSIKSFEKEGIQLIFPRTYTISSIVPVKNKKQI